MGNNKLKKIAIFGATGYVGNSIYLGLKENYNLVPFTRREDDFFTLSEKKCDHIPKDIDAIIFVIGSTELNANSFNDSVNSTINTFAVFLDRHKIDIPNIPIIYISTFQVYGKSEGLVNEKTPTNPNNIYSLVHKQSELKR